MKVSCLKALGNNWTLTIMYFDKLYILQGVHDGVRNHAKDLYDDLNDYGVPCEIIDVNSSQILQTTICCLSKEEKDIALYFDFHGDANGILLSDDYYETWNKLMSLMNLFSINNNLKVVTMNVCQGAEILKTQSSNMFFENLIASYKEVNASECTNRSMAYYKTLYSCGQPDKAWQAFLNVSNLGGSDFHWFENGIMIS